MTDLEKTIHKSKKSAANGEDLPYSPYSSLGLPELFAVKVRELSDTSAIIKQLEEEKKTIQSFLQSCLNDHKIDRARVGDLRVLCYEGGTAQINQKKLLENGVSMDIIEASKTRTTYLVVKIMKD
jgi:hypothetical protein